MKILYVIHDNKKGGAALSFLEMIEQVKKEHEIFVLTPHKKGFLPEKLSEMEIPYKNVHYFWWMVQCPSNLWGRKIKLLIYYFLGWITKVEAFRWGKLLKEHQYDIVHSNGSVIHFGGLLAHELEVPHVWHIREFAQEFGFVPIYNRGYINECYNKYTSKAIAISEAIRTDFLKILPEEKVVCIYNAVSKNYNIQKETFPVKGDRIVFSIVGNYTLNKGQIYVAQAVEYLVEQGMTNFEVWMAGSGEFEEVKELINKHNLQDNIKLLGDINDTLSVRKKADVEIVASKCEAFGRVTVEAMKASMPVIGTNTGGTTELIEEGSTGYLFDFGDYVRLAEIMQEFIDNPLKIAYMGKRAYLKMCNRFTPEENGRNILDVYDELVNKQYRWN